ncbi:hypothetical protein GpartN1_g6132.t1 [Galdieria partita]|uniref:Uncharacterized protein n=1 Tax=Galdieria partita TaxID=83374 RepID=A0A9C7Q2L8_9RHOD|nr:hypothetical protein GpartN1_g6132.t1 [Galdieria partita]
MSDASESVLVETRYSAWKNGARSVFDDHETRNQLKGANKLHEGSLQSVANQNTRGLRRTHSCPLFLLLKQDALEGKKVRLGRGALEYLRHRQERSLSRSFSQSDLATIKEVEEELEDTLTKEAGTIVFSDSQKDNCYHQPKPLEAVCFTEENKRDLVEKATKVNGNGSSRVSRRTLEKLAEDYSKRKNVDSHSQLPPLPRSRNSSSYEQGRGILEQSRNRAYELSTRSNVSVGQTRRNNISSYHMSSSSMEPDYYSMYHGVFGTKPNYSTSCKESKMNPSDLAESVELNTSINNQVQSVSDKDSSSVVERENVGDNSEEFSESDLQSLQVQNKLSLGRTLWEPPLVWKVPEHHQWTGHDVRTNEYGGWWTERWGCSLDKTCRFGDKYGVDNDGSAWAEWWLERDLDIQERGATMFVKKGRRWGYNQKNESWMETWNMTANGTYYTEFQMLPSSEFLGL